MKLFSENENYKLYHGNMLDMLEVIEPNSIDSIVTDPPYGLTSIVKRFGKEDSAPAKFGKDGAFSRLSKGFMGQEWDGSGIEYNINTWKKCYDVLKPGGYLLAFGGTRTYHRIACAIEDAGFEMRDTIMWIYGSGFPKSMNLGNKLNGWQGWGTCLKPSYEPIIIARKPFKGSLVDNVIKNGVGGINIDECRVESNGEKIAVVKSFEDKTYSSQFDNEMYRFKQVNTELKEIGRFPANTILTYDETDFDEVCGGFPITKGGGKTKEKGTYGFCFDTGKRDSKPMADGYDDKGSASRYFYCAKATKKDRDDGLETFNNETVGDGRLTPIDNPFQRGETPRKNIHPTVKPTELMQYLVRLVTPKGGTVLDPFNGSGSTGKAVMYENKERDKNYKYIGVELNEDYLAISKARIEYVDKKEVIR